VFGKFWQLGKKKKEVAKGTKGFFCGKDGHKLPWYEGKKS
jgi:hypothetical protein